MAENEGIRNDADYRKWTEENLRAREQFFAQLNASAIAEELVRIGKPARPPLRRPPEADKATAEPVQPRKSSRISKNPPVNYDESTKNLNFVIVERKKRARKFITYDSDEEENDKEEEEEDMDDDDDDDDEDEDDAKYFDTDEDEKSQTQLAPESAPTRKSSRTSKTRFKSFDESTDLWLKPDIETMKKVAAHIAGQTENPESYLTAGKNEVRKKLSNIIKFFPEFLELSLKRQRQFYMIFKDWNPTWSVFIYIGSHANLSTPPKIAGIDESDMLVIAKILQKMLDAAIAKEKYITEKKKR